MGSEMCIRDRLLLIFFSHFRIFFDFTYLKIATVVLHVLLLRWVYTVHQVAIVKISGKFFEDREDAVTCVHTAGR